MKLKKCALRIIGLMVLSTLPISVNAAQASHVTGGYVYSYVGWRSIATNGREYFGINPTLPSVNSADANVRQAIRQAAAAWNVTRPEQDYITEVSWSDPNNHKQFIEHYAEIFHRRRS